MNHNKTEINNAVTALKADNSIYQTSVRIGYLKDSDR